MQILNKNNNKLKLILVSVAAVLILMVGGLTYGYIQNNYNQAQASILQNQVFLDSTTEYSNTTAGFSIRYYPDWMKSETETSVAFYTNFENMSDSYVENVTVQVYDNFSVDDYSLGLTLISTEQSTVNDLPATKLVSTSPFGNTQLQSVTYVVTKGEKTFLLQYTGQIGGGYDKFLSPGMEMIDSVQV